MFAVHASSLGPKIAQDAGGVTHDDLDVGFTHNSRPGEGGNAFLEHPADGLKSVAQGLFDFRDGPVDHAAVEVAAHEIAVGPVGGLVPRDGLTRKSEALLEGGVEV